MWLAWEVSDYSGFLQGGQLPLVSRDPGGSCKPSYDPALGVTVSCALYSIGYKPVAGLAQIQGEGTTKRCEHWDTWLPGGPSLETS